jgi:hypothetical protein
MLQFILELLLEQKIVTILIIIIFTALKVQQLRLIVDIEIMLMRIKFAKLMALFLIHLVVVTGLVHMLLVELVSMYQHALLQVRLVVIIQDPLVELASGVSVMFVLLVHGFIKVAKI